MIVKDKDGKVSAVSVRYHGVDVYISKDMFTGENKSINPSTMAEVLELARLDPETRAAVDEMVQGILG